MAVPLPDYVESDDTLADRVDVAIIGGGYDSGQDNPGYREDSVGNAIYMLDLETGALLWSAGEDSDHNLRLDWLDACGQAWTTGRGGVLDRGIGLRGLLIGSEGTLAIITEATLKLTPLAEAKRTLQATYSDIHAAAHAVAAIMAQPVTPCALEFMDKTAIRMVRDHSDLGLDETVGALLMIEVDGPANGIEEAAQRIAAR